MSNMLAACRVNDERRWSRLFSSLIVSHVRNSGYSQAIDLSTGIRRVKASLAAACITNSPTLTTVGGKPEEMVFTAPCSTGYNCMASATSPFLIPLGRQGNCVRAQRAVGMTCVSGNDCAADECCVSKMRPLGKRQLGGSCQKLKNANEGGCFVNQPNGKPETMVYGCPCRQGLSCNPGPIPMFDIPLGQVGTCQ